MNKVNRNGVCSMKDNWFGILI